MSDQTTPSIENWNNRVPKFRRSAGLKLIMICALVLIMSIPVMFIGAISYERSSSAQQVVRDVSQRYGGAQTALGPILSIPYRVEGSEDRTGETGHYIFYADDGQIDISDVSVEMKQQSLYKIPIYTARGKWNANFKDIQPRFEKTDVELDLDKAKLIVSVSNVRGLKSDVYARNSAGEKRIFEPAGFEGYDQRAVPAVLAYDENGTSRIVKPPIPASTYNHLPQIGTWLSVNVSDWLKAEGDFKVSADITLSGAESLSLPPFAKSTQVKMQSNWPHPGFTGEFTPLTHDIKEDGFSAEWNMPFLSRGVADQGRSHHVLAGLERNKVSVKFVDKASPYQTVNRALKYSVLFIGLVFLSYFLFEIIVAVPVHPAQYILIGLAQAIFYLLLLAFAERIGFSPAFMIAAIMTVLITSFYAGAVFGDKSYAIKSGVVFTLVYGLLFVLMRIEDFALMIGALASFVAIAATMYLTRNMDWYGDRSKAQP